jgi:hypothetical protein
MDYTIKNSRGPLNRGPVGSYQSKRREMSFSKLVWDFKCVCKFCESNESKHQAKGYKYFIEQYIADVKGELRMDF